MEKFDKTMKRRLNVGTGRRNRKKYIEDIRRIEDSISKGEENA